MLLIPCPHCGDRDESEFDYGGRALAMPDLATTAEWHQAIHLGSDTEDCADEYWYHVGGCECWIRLRRNLLTHDFVDIDSAGLEATN